jgi:hypothetical protein
MVLIVEDRTGGSSFQTKVGTTIQSISVHLWLNFLGISSRFFFALRVSASLRLKFYVINISFPAVDKHSIFA